MCVKYEEVLLLYRNQQLNQPHKLSTSGHKNANTRQSTLPESYQSSTTSRGSDGTWERTILALLYSRWGCECEIYGDVTSLSTPLAVYLCLHTCVWLWWLFASFISQQTQRAIQRPEMQQRDNLEQQRHLRAAGHAWCKQEQRPSKHEPALKCCRP